MGADAAVNAVYYNKLAAVADPQDREQETRRLRPGTRPISTCSGWPASWFIDDIVPPGELRAELNPPVRGRRRQGPLILTADVTVSPQSDPSRPVVRGIPGGRAL